MTICDKYKEKIIENYYSKGNEKNIELEEHIKNCEECRSFQENLNKSFDILEKVDHINNEEDNEDVNLLSIIQKAEDIKIKQRDKKELIIFLLVACFVMTSFLIITICFQRSSLINFEIIAAAVIPLTVLSFSLVLKLRGE